MQRGVLLPVRHFSLYGRMRRSRHSSILGTRPTPTPAPEKVTAGLLHHREMLLHVQRLLQLALRRDGIKGQGKDWASLSSAETMHPPMHPPMHPHMHKHATGVPYSRDRDFTFMHNLLETNLSFRWRTSENTY